MIATVTLNPAVDKTVTASRVVLGAVNRLDDVTNIAGGKGINVTKVLRQYGYEVKALGFIGGYAGELIADTVRRIGALDAFTFVKGETRTSINLLTEDGYVTELLEPGPKIIPSELRRFLNSFEAEIEHCEIVVISGSAPRGVPATVYADLIEIAKNNNKKVLLDTSGEGLKKGMYARPFMIKPNVKELEGLMGRRVHGMQEISEAAIQIVEWGVPNVMISMGAKGILYARESKRSKKGVNLYYVQAPNIKAVNTVGSGDAAVAAFAMAVSEKLKPENICRKCVAISAANAMSKVSGEIPRMEADQIYEELGLSIPIY